MTLLLKYAQVPILQYTIAPINYFQHPKKKRLILYAKIDQNKFHKIINNLFLLNISLKIEKNINNVVEQFNILVRTII